MVEGPVLKGAGREWFSEESTSVEFAARDVQLIHCLSRFQSQRHRAMVTRFRKWIVDATMDGCLSIVA